MSTPDAVDPARLERWAERLRSLPAIALPTDYPRPATTQVVTAFTRTRLDRRARNAIARLALYTEEEEHSGAPGEGEDSDEETHEEDAAGPTAFHILLAAFVVLLHRYTGDTDLVIGTSSPVDGSPLIVRVPIEPGDAFWQVVRRIQTAEAEAAADNLPYDVIAKRLEADRAAAGETLSAPLFRVRFLDETSGGAGRDFIQATASTTDLTIFVTGPDAAAPGTEEDTPTPKTSAFGTASSTLRQSILPDIALHLSYNALLFTSARMSFLVNQLLHLVSTASADPTTPVGTISLRTPSEDKILPDPRKDLDWCGFRGSITDIFERNAAHFPNRRCLVESLSTETESGELVPPASRVREVSYGELDAASNVLAHHLLDSGVQREEVVTVYAHRGVDLVVAVLGTLKAGATFSVIDPAYPASRQNIYLQVAKPRALVILAKAGRLAPAVRQYIENELDLRTEVPALELTMDGKIHGGAASEGAGDVLDSSQHKAKQSTGVVLGPDSVGTLSFTSGSTGIPKGVQGRHHSLTHFFPWMGERFNLTSKDRFLMLSGIAHDPIQRDMFTPLFFGAELHIPTAEDIGTPGRLAEWMAATQATVVHLTPAMGQLLTAQATVSIPSLRNAFFVGDVLTKRDCTRLQALAGNVVIINMYGTTETQRAVSYFALPSINEDAAFLRGQKDIMPAGQGMIDVQLLVVNRNDRMVTTGVGEVGEIYVRSGGLAEGYLGPPEMSAEKFVPNFLASDLQWEDTLKGTPEGQFWKGVRDRMYRTGDLGRYLPDGTVECTGRADDQIKIRGFRIELGEIDTHLSRHPHVRENVTLVRRDKNEDKVLVSYFVPGAGAVEYEEELSSAASGDEGTSPRDAALVRAVKKYRNLIKDMREFLKRKLPSYSVPTHFVPMSKMPLNPNGKIDKPALPFPDTALANATALKKSSHRATGVADRQLTPTETTVAQLWSQLLPSVSQPIPTDESFFDLGGHSILATRLVFELRKAFVINIPLGVVFDRPTLASLAQAIDGIRAQDGSLGMTVPGSGSAKDAQGAAGSGEVDYAGDLAPLTAGLPEVYSPAHPARDNLTVLLTGATGFLGSYVLADLLGKRKNVGRVLAHVRAKDPSAGLARLETACTNRGVWDASWVSQGRVEAVVGDLEKEELGVDKAAWERLAKEVDVIIHNGALVHWVYPYQRLRAANVLSTQALLKLAGRGKPKTLTFVSSTSALDTSYYTDLSDSLTSSGRGSGVPESDSLDGSRKGLKTGYGQSKWVAEQLVMAAVARGARAGIVRPGYVVGDSATGTSNTDDFLIRLIKGCAQLGAYAEIRNLVNMVPVDHVARITALAALDITLSPERVLQSPSGLGNPFTPAPVFHVEGHPKVTYDLVLGSLALYGWEVQRQEYMTWRKNLEEHVLASSKMNEEDNALFPLLHFVLDDLPTSTKSPSLDDRNTLRILAAAQESPDNGVAAGMTTETLGLYLSWLTAVGFLSPPSVPVGTKLSAGDEQESHAAAAAEVLPLPAVHANANAALGRASAH